MKTFKEFLDEATKLDDSGMPVTMTPDRAVKVLDRTRQSIRSHVGYGGQPNHRRAIDLVDRYNDHKSWLKDKSPEHWKKYCEKHGSHPDHDGWDLYA